MNLKFNTTKIKQLAKQYNINTLYLFGSQATGKTHKNSDYDFAVQFQNNVNPKKYFDSKIKILSQIERIIQNNKFNKNKKIDIIILNSQTTPLSLKFQAIKTGKKLYSKNDLLRSELEHKIISFYLDRKYYFKQRADIILKNIAKRGTL